MLNNRCSVLKVECAGRKRADKRYRCGESVKPEKGAGRSPEGLTP